MASVARPAAKASSGSAAFAHAGQPLAACRPRSPGRRSTMRAKASRARAAISAAGAACSPSARAASRTRPGGVRLAPAGLRLGLERAHEQHGAGVGLVHRAHCAGAAVAPCGAAPGTAFLPARRSASRGYHACGIAIRRSGLLAARTRWLPCESRHGAQRGREQRAARRPSPAGSGHGKVEADAIHAAGTARHRCR